MKIRMVLKTPDAIDNALMDVPDEIKGNVRNVLEKWLKWGECLTVEIDTDTETCIPIPVR